MLSTHTLRLALALAAGLLVSAEPTLAQQGGRPGGGTGRPDFPPGLHDRTLPPGRPFDPPDGFNPPGRINGPGGLEDVEEVDEYLARVMADPRFPEGGTLGQAVDAYNFLVLTLSEEDLRTPPPAFSRAQQMLPRFLGFAGARVASIEGGPGAASPSARPALLPGGSEPMQQRMSSWAIPGMSAATPLGFGAGWGSVWAGASYQPRVRYGDGEDGAVALGFGLGDARRYVGLQVGVISFSTINSGFGDRTALDLHLHRRIGDAWSVAVGVESLGAGYKVARDSDKNVYVVGSRWLQLRDDPDAPFGLAMMSLGVGSGRFQLEEDFYAGRNGVGVFGSFGVRVLQPLSLITEWTGQDLMIAASVTPLRDYGLAITGGFTEITGAAGDGARFTVGGSVGLSFR